MIPGDSASEAVLRPQFSPGERLLWSGRPRRGLVLRRADVFLIPFSVLWIGVVVSSLTVSVLSGSPLSLRLPFLLFNVAFLLIGLYLLFGRFVFDAFRRAGTFYGVTDGRVIFVSGRHGRSVKSLNLRALTDVSLNEKSGGGGTITFEPESPFPAWWTLFTWGNRQLRPGFELVGDARRVYEVILRDAQRQT